MPSAIDPRLADSYAHYDHSFLSNMYPSRYLHLFPPNPYQTLNLPPPPPPAAPQPVAHKVWIIDCRSCGSFLTNRGMKAVLLLRPNVPLFSSDALPANCSAFTFNPDALKPPVSCRPPIQPSRTCECLTQTLCCQGCGSTIGYMIVIPCIRCTSSISANNRATNGHRFVFHSNEVVGTERYHVPNEPGVIPFETVPLFISSSLHMRHTIPSPEFSSLYTPSPPLNGTESSSISSSHSFVINEHPGLSHPSPSSNPMSSEYDESLARLSGATLTQTQYSPPPLLSNDSPFALGMPVEQSEIPLKGGDPLFWHHLIRHGEIPAVFDDPRSRKPSPADLPHKSVAFGR
ncbi:hypothetical protein F5880DRAFT_1590357 [Lentinula raphanica]|nr:hypothetical protein F5880DRAFT_1590357 [Lentinula raphanica]